MLHPTKSEDGEITDVTAGEALLHFLSVGWKVLFAFCPPAHVWNGVPCFFAALTFIGIVTAIVGEVAALMGCVIGLKPGITAITFVAIGTSLPDTFASMTAAKESRYADSAVGNVTGSNSVNVFLGLGLPWVIAVVYEAQYNAETNPSGNYRYPARGLDLSVLLFLVCSLIGIVILVSRRIYVKGELGGSLAGRTISCIVFCSLWLVYVAGASLYQLDLLPINLLTPPDWYTCSKDPAGETCTSFCNATPSDVACMKVCATKRIADSYAWCPQEQETTSTGDAGDD
jgi:solute carrier family 8 (sodium/calcium exchanger)